MDILANAGQVAEYGLHLIAFLCATYQKIKDAPGAVEQHTKRINQLLGITQSIQQTSYPQDSIVFAHINLIHLEAKKLATILCRTSDKCNRKSIAAYWEIIKGTQEKQIAAIFDELEKSKSGLILCLASHNADSLRVVLNSVKQIETAMTHPIEQTVIVSTEDYQQVLFRREFGSSPGSFIPENQALIPRANHYLERVEQNIGDSSMRIKSETPLRKQQKRIDDSQEENKQQSEYEASGGNEMPPIAENIYHYIENNELKDNAVLLNGSQFIGFSSVPSDISSHKSVVKKNLGGGESITINGVQVIAPSSGTNRAPVFSGKWLRNAMMLGKQNRD